MKISTILLISIITLNLIHSIYNIYLLWKIKRREAHIVLLSKDEKPIIKKINPDVETYTHKEEAYILPEKRSTYIPIGRKKYVVYNRGNPEPLHPYNDMKPMLKAETLKKILDNEVLKQLNTVNGMFGKMDIRKALLIGGVIVIAIIMFG